MKIGDTTVVLEMTRPDWTQPKDPYGNQPTTTTYRPIRWCSLTPARSSEDQTRTGPAIVGANLVTPRYSTDAGVRYDNFVDVLAADSIISDPVGPDGTGRYTGRRWEILGEVGKWDESVEMLLRRLV
jgi:hypothetical protein